MIHHDCTIVSLLDCMNVWLHYNLFQRHLRGIWSGTDGPRDSPELHAEEVMTACFSDCVIVWLYDCMIVWLYDCMILWLDLSLHDCTIVWLHDSLIAWLCDCIIFWLCDCTIVWLYDFLIVWLHDYTITSIVKELCEKTTAKSIQWYKYSMPMLQCYSKLEVRNHELYPQRS